MVVTLRNQGPRRAISGKSARAAGRLLCGLNERPCGRSPYIFWVLSDSTLATYGASCAVAELGHGGRSPAKGLFAISVSATLVANISRNQQDPIFAGTLYLTPTLSLTFEVGISKRNKRARDRLCSPTWRCWLNRDWIDTTELQVTHNPSERSPPSAGTQILL